MEKPDIEGWEEFLVTKHAQQRLHERLQTNPRKYKHVAFKAWYRGSLELRSWGKWQYALKFHDDPMIIYKEHMGYLFIFKLQYFQANRTPQKKLITVVRKNFVD